MKALVFALTVPVLGLAATSPANAEVHVGLRVAIGRPAYREGYGYGRVDTSRYGYDRGNREGASDGYRDGERGHRFELYREGDYRDADKGYKGWMGPRWEYAHGYRRGFEEGYRRAYEQGRRRCERDGHYGHGRYDGDDDERIYEQPRRRY